MIERLINRFIHSIKSFALVLTAIADLASNCLGFYFLGYDLATHIALPIFGVVVTGAILYGWGENKKWLAYLGAIFSTFLMLSIFLAVIDTQNQNVIAQNSTSELDQQIKDKLADIEKTKIVRDSNKDPWDWKIFDKNVTTKAAELEALKAQRASLGANQEEQRTISLNAWAIFRQISDFDWSDRARVVAFCTLLFLAILIQTIIGFTVPRQSQIKIEEKENISKKRPRKLKESDKEDWINLNLTKGSGKVLEESAFVSEMTSLGRRFPKKFYQEIRKKCEEQKVIDKSGLFLVRDKDEILRRIS